MREHAVQAIAVSKGESSPEAWQFGPTLEQIVDCKEISHAAYGSEADGFYFFKCGSLQGTGSGDQLYMPLAEISGRIDDAFGRLPVEAI